MGWTLLIHGGAGTAELAGTTPAQQVEALPSLRRALSTGTSILEKGGSALDAVERAVRAMEDDPRFNAGRGSVFTADGTIELDAAIMDGVTRRAGAVAGVSSTKNPISLARAVMEHTPHVMLFGPAADRFALEQGINQVDPSYFRTEQRWQQLQEWCNRKPDAKCLDQKVEHGTVGAVARDMAGHVAAATSTGGMTGALSGRVGDSPIIGAGTYADDRACAVSATGWGEFFIREGVAHEICARIRFLQESPQAAADAVVAETLALGGQGGVIAVGADGTPAWSFNTQCMYRGRGSAGQEPVVEIT